MWKVEEIVNTYKRVMRMSHTEQKHWLRQAVTYGLACSCKSGYCAKHDDRLQQLIDSEREIMKKEGLI